MSDEIRHLGRVDAALLDTKGERPCDGVLRGGLNGSDEEEEPVSGARVVLVDMLPQKNITLLSSYYDSEGNYLHRRRLPSGEEFDIVKNFPTEKELFSVFEGVAEDQEYREHDYLRRWMLAFRKK